jgi:hypothetical protein
LNGRYREAKKNQDTAGRIYGTKNITTIGHSQGAYQAQLLGDTSHEIITLNKAKDRKRFYMEVQRKKTI